MDLRKSLKSRSLDAPGALGGGYDGGGCSGCEERVFTMSDILMNENRLKNRSHRRRQTVDAQFLIDDVAR
jgi:hypothetical protein